MGSFLSIPPPPALKCNIILYSKARLKPPLTPLTDGTDAQWPSTVGLPLSASTWELAREVEASPDSGRAVVKGQEESNFPSLRTG
jgi:hypothetical protein